MNPRQEDQGKVHASHSQTVAAFWLVTPAHVNEEYAPADAGGEAAFFPENCSPPTSRPTHMLREKEREPEREKQKGRERRERERKGANLPFEGPQQNSRGASLAAQL